ncbi:MAG: chorismate synthase, partial [Patescibacteria group bacterium]|nr:chorismate synthase [Patescibacteria group bacterium]
GLEISQEAINAELRRRQGGYGRGGRQKLEADTVEVLSGTWRGATLGSPIALLVPNHDYKIESMEDLDRPRPGHGDLSGSLKYLTSIRAILERASARETAARVAAGALANQLLAEFGMTAFGYVVQVGPVAVPPKPGSLAEQRQRRDQSAVYSLDPDRDEELKAVIGQAGRQGDTLGGIVEIRVEGVPFGLGTHAQWDRKLDGRLAQAVMAVQAMKGCEIGLGFECAKRQGSQVHDPIQYDPSQRDTPTLGFSRPSNNAGGLEAGMTNSQPIILRVAKKPIATLHSPLESINLRTKQPEQASYERSDICAIAAASCILENVVAFTMAQALVEKFGGDSVQEMKARYDLFHEMARQHY